MGAGKTSVGRALGQRLNWLFEDLDDRIEQREGRRVADIFRDSGEIAFRAAEHAALNAVLDELRNGEYKIVALGGGAFAQPKNAALLSHAGVATVFLEAPVEELWARCSRQAAETGAERPLLRSLEQFRQLHNERRKSYAEALTIVKTGARTVEDIAAEIAQSLGLKQITIRVEQGDVE